MDWQKKVEYHHAYAKTIAAEHGDYQVLWTSLVGSQNYGLDSENSDVDTFTIVLPTYFDFITKTNLISFETDCLDGKCIVKDLRLMMNLLRKTSPNSIEVVASRYKVVEPEYETIALAFFNPDTLFYLIHANYYNMINAIAGLAHQVHGRNMSEGKRYSHTLRMYDMEHNFLNNQRADQILSFCDGETHVAARVAKFETDTEHDEYYAEESRRIATELKTFADMFVKTNQMNSIEYTSNYTIGRLQFELTKKMQEEILHQSN